MSVGLRQRGEHSSTKKSSDHRLKLRNNEKMKKRRQTLRLNTALCRSTAVMTPCRSRRTKEEKKRVKPAPPHLQDCPRPVGDVTPPFVALRCELGGVNVTVHLQGPGEKQDSPGSQTTPCWWLLQPEESCSGFPALLRWVPAGWPHSERRSHLDTPEPPQHRCAGSDTGFEFKSLKLPRSHPHLYAGNYSPDLLFSALLHVSRLTK